MWTRSRYGLNKISNSIEQLLLNEPGLYQPWLEMTSYRRKKLKKSIQQVIRQEFLGVKFRKALANDILGEGTVNTDLHLFTYLKNTIYQGNIRGLLSDLQSIKEEK